MKRFLTSALEKWKKAPQRKPLLIYGARQVGKTWLMKHFGELHFKKVAYIRFDRNERIQSLFNDDYDIKRILLGLQIEVGFEIHPKDTLIIFDEIQECPRAVTCLKYFCEDAPEYAVMAAGSLLGVMTLSGSGFPVGKVNILTLFPMTFSEFVLATGNAQLYALLNARDWKMITTFQSKFIELLRQYYFVGGMPEAVSTFINARDFSRVREVQMQLLDGYSKDFAKHAPSEVIPKIQMIWDSIPSQLARENKKFIYGAVRDSYRAKDLEDSLQWLLSAGLIYQTPRITKPAIPLDAYRDVSFKLYFLDVGLLAAKSNLDIKSLIEGNRIFVEFKGALTEQYVQQELRAASEIMPYYWSAERSSAEIDFIFQIGMNVVPLEVKAERNLQAKSLKSYALKYAPLLEIRTSMADYHVQNIDKGDGDSYKLIDIPLYAINQITEECETQRF